MTGDIRRRADLLGFTPQDDFPESDLDEINAVVLVDCVKRRVLPEIAAGAHSVADRLYGLAYTAHNALLVHGLNVGQREPSLGEYSRFCDGFALYGLTYRLTGTGLVDEAAVVKQVDTLLVQPGDMADLEMSQTYGDWRARYPNLRAVIRSDIKPEENMTDRAMREMGAMAAHTLGLPLI